MAYLTLVFTETPVSITIPHLLSFLWLRGIQLTNTASVFLCLPCASFPHLKTKPLSRNVKAPTRGHRTWQVKEHEAPVCNIM
ncbi:unnamed protein product [Victoria cruziana]